MSLSLNIQIHTFLGESIGGRSSLLNSSVADLDRLGGYETFACEVLLVLSVRWEVRSHCLGDVELRVPLQVFARLSLWCPSPANVVLFTFDPEVAFAVIRGIDLGSLLLRDT